MPLVTIVILMLVFVLYVPTHAASANFIVNSAADTNDGNCNADDCTLREAILAANAMPDADIITFSLLPNSTITLNGTVLPFITGMLTIDGSTAENLTISGDNASRIFVIDSIPPDYLAPNENYNNNVIGTGTTVTLTNLTITAGSKVGGYGGGIFNNGKLFINNSIVTYITSGYGAIFNNQNLTVTNSIFSYNTSSAYGGVIFNHNYGGAIFNLDTLIVEDTTFNNNLSGDGGAISNDSTGTLYVLNSTFYDNFASSGGGALSNFNALTIVNSTFSSNTSSFGGAILNKFNRTLTVTNSTISGNSASSDGGGIFNQGILNINNTIIANSINGGDCFNIATINANINNLIEDGSCNPLFDIDPLLGALQDNGGDTWTHALLSGSSAIDAGHSVTCAEPPVNNLDQRSKPRPFDGDGDGVAICDIRSYENDTWTIYLPFMLKPE